MLNIINFLISIIAIVFVIFTIGIFIVDEDKLYKIKFILSIFSGTFALYAYFFDKNDILMEIYGGYFEVLLYVFIYSVIIGIVILIIIIVVYGIYEIVFIHYLEKEKQKYLIDILKSHEKMGTEMDENFLESFIVFFERYDNEFKIIIANTIERVVPIFGYAIYLITLFLLQGIFFNEYFRNFGL